MVAPGKAETMIETSEPQTSFGKLHDVKNALSEIQTDAKEAGAALHSLLSLLDHLWPEGDSGMLRQRTVKTGDQGTIYRLVNQARDAVRKIAD